MKTIVKSGETAVELFASTFLSLIEKTTDDYDVKKEMKTNLMTLGAINDTNHEYRYETLNESEDLDKEINNNHVDRE